MKPFSFALLVLAVSGCASSSKTGSETPAGYRGIEEIRILAKGME